MLLNSSHSEVWFVLSEVETLLSELAEAREQLTAAEHSVQIKEQELFEERRATDVSEDLKVYCCPLVLFTSLGKSNDIECTGTRETHH